MTSKQLQIQTLSTPNPHSLKFVFNQTISEDTMEFNQSSPKHSSALAKKLLGFPWVQSVFIGIDFITINKEDWLEWDSLIESIKDMLIQHIQSEEPILLKKTLPSPLLNTEESKIVQQITKVIEEQIQPQVQLDGGYIRFSKFENGSVYVQMEGACSGCPSATFTLKQGIEALLKQEIPEVKEVIPV